ncbi:MAG: type II toxin-antitoxin system prevent-host-death family antitoxin [Sideroxydans sp.]|nr:type II toxin-antitoxin system prevent-host-death family antitoxin [Sideroxydans sp.]
MEVITYSHTRQHLAEVMDKVTDDCAPVLITCQTGSPVVMMSLQAFNALEETAYPLHSPKNARRLMESIEQLSVQGNIAQEAQHRHSP